jgi:hypothetical protein
MNALRLILFVAAFACLLGGFLGLGRRYSLTALGLAIWLWTAQIMPLLW